MARPRSEHSNPIDAMMEAASRSLVERRYFEAEQRCMESLRTAYVSQDYERMARIVLPLEEARRQKRDLAADSGRVVVIDGELPADADLAPGCYLVCPPRVGLDGRLLREQADRAGVPIVVVVREPTTREGLWPVVALGPVTLRTKVRPPTPETPGEAAAAIIKRAAARGKAVKNRAPEEPPRTIPPPSIEWFLGANEALGDSAIESVDPDLDPLMRVDALMKRLEAHPDHEKLHQAVGAACRESVLFLAGSGKSRRALPARQPLDDLDDVDGDDDDSDL